jgi:thioredoxin reductase (NADPH)
MTDSDSSDDADAQQNSALDTALDVTDPIAREADTFPRLSAEMLARIARYGSEERFAAGAPIYSRGDRNVDFFVVVEGSIEIFDVDDYDKPRVFLVLRSHQFSGELNLFNEREVLVSARAGEASRLLRIRRADFRRLVSIDADIGEIVMRAFILRRVNLIRHVHGGVVVIGPAHTADTLRLIQFLSRNAYPHRLVDTEHDAGGDGFLDCLSLGAADLPVVIAPGHRVLRKPSLAQLADDLGLTETFDHAQVFDLAVVGAGPAGLAAAVYGASEGLQTIVIESMAPGGQAGTSSKIENYLGFPTGISGQALAGRAQVQAQKFGARLALSRAVVGLDCERAPYTLKLEDGESIRARAIVIATGARYRKLDVDDYERFEGAGIYYAATAMEADLCAEQEIVVVGGGNSAGQAAVFLARSAKHVHMLCRAKGLAATMSDYLVQRIERSDRITLHPHSEVSALAGDASLQSVTWTNRASGEPTTRPARSIFVMIGAEPNTQWAAGCLVLDAQGFICTGAKAGADADSPYVTSREGVYAVGDVRSGSVKRVASGVGEGSVVVQAIHRFLNPAPA